MEKIVVNTAVQQHKAVLKPFSQGEVRLYEGNICVVVLPTNTFLGWRDRRVFFFLQENIRTKQPDLLKHGLDIMHPPLLLLSHIILMKILFQCQYQ